MTETLCAVLGHNAYALHPRPRLVLLSRDKRQAEELCRVKNRDSRGMRYLVQSGKVE